MLTVLAVDPGLSGAVVVVNENGALVRCSRDFKSLKHLAEAICLYQDLESPHVQVLELVSARPGQGVTSMFTFGRATGVALGQLLALHTRPVIEISPQAWQQFWALLYPGKDSRAIVGMMLGSDHPALRRKKDHNTADAYLLGMYAVRQLQQGKLVSSRKKDLDRVGTCPEFSLPGKGPLEL
jgi:crossover junction endodeoxyribonuclease RuvC